MDLLLREEVGGLRLQGEEVDLLLQGEVGGLRSQLEAGVRGQFLPGEV